MRLYVEYSYLSNITIGKYNVLNSSNKTLRKKIISDKVEEDMMKSVVDHVR